MPEPWGWMVSSVVARKDLTDNIGIAIGYCTRECSERFETTEMTRDERLVSTRIRIHIHYSIPNLLKQKFSLRLHNNIYLL